MKKQLSIFFLCTCLLSGCNETNNTSEERKIRAEELFRSVYGGDPSQIDSLVTDNVISTYPIFERLFDEKAIRGRDSYKDFSIGFSERWNQAHVTINEAIAEDNNVVLVWTFKAKKIGTTPDSSYVDGQQYSWGGITLFQFDESGKITAEIGEESSPGPFERIKK